MEANRFAPPGAVVDDVSSFEGGVQPIRLWPPSGRLGRLRLLAYNMGLYVLFVLLMLILGGVGAVAGSRTYVPIIIGTVVYLFCSGLLLIQRSHDMNVSGWWSLASIIPLVGLVWIFVPGTRGSNRWGAPPPPNSLGVKIIGLMLPVVFVIGIVAAVALPAYQTYAIRAHAAASR